MAGLRSFENLSDPTETLIDPTETLIDPTEPLSDSINTLRDLTMRTSILKAIPMIFLMGVCGFAESYQADVDLGSSSQEELGSTNQVKGTFYFTPVNIRNAPLAEAAFINRNSSISLTYQQYSSDTAYENATPSLYQREFYRGAVSVYIPDSIFYVSLGVEDGTDTLIVDSGSFTGGGAPVVIRSEMESEYNQVFATLGITPIDGLLISSDFYEDRDVSDYQNINFKYVTQIGGKDVNFEASYEHGEFYQSIKLSSDYYFDDRTSFGIGATYLKNDTSEVYREDQKTYFLRGRKFVTDYTSFDLLYLTSENYSREHEEFKVGASYRF